ncbi:unnamed protein product [Alopecurus aequalis]
MSSASETSDGERESAWYIADANHNRVPSFILIRDSDDSDEFEWDIDGEAEPSLAAANRNFDAPGPSTLDDDGRINGKASSDLVEKYMGMGLQKKDVLKGIKEIGHNDGDKFLNHLLTSKFLDDDHVGGCSTSGCAPLSVQDDNDDDLDFNWDSDEDAGGREPNYDSSGDEDFLQEMEEKDEKIKNLQEMGFTGDEVYMAITTCGVDAPLDVLVDSISASQHEVTNRCSDSFGERKKAKTMESKNKRKLNGGGAQGNRLRRRLDGSVRLPNKMAGFSLPTDRHRLPPVNRTLPEKASGRPFFYYENVAQAPKGTWSTISGTLYDIEPEFLDSMHICATARKRGYLHNLPIKNRSLRPLPLSTIFEIFPDYKQWWPAWDERNKFNCLQTVVAPATVTKQIQLHLARSSSPPPLNVQNWIIYQCKKWNLVWVGKNKAAPLEPQEMEQLLGFPSGHTRGVSKKDRYKSLGNAFQVDTVTYHLSVLRSMFPKGMNVLSLFSGIGGAEVALHRLGVRMNAVVSVEISEVNRGIFKGWWDQTEQHGELIEFEDVENLSDEMIKSLTTRLGGFDLVIGGSPCNNLAGSNRHHRDGLQGEKSSLFYQYARILRVVKSEMARMYA